MSTHTVSRLRSSTPASPDGVTCHLLVCRITTVTKLGVRVCVCVEEREEEVKNESVTEQSQVLVWINIFVGKLEACVCVTLHLRMISGNR